LGRGRRYHNNAIIVVLEGIGISGHDFDLGAVDESFWPIAGVKLVRPVLWSTDSKFSFPKILVQTTVGTIIFGISFWGTRVGRKLFVWSR
jgi:hypothetical protein